MGGSTGGDGMFIGGRPADPEEELVAVILPLRIVRHIVETNDVLLVAGGTKILEACQRAVETRDGF